MKEDNTCYIERSKVREILITSNANNETTRELLADVDALNIFVASDFAPVSQPEVQSGDADLAHPERLKALSDAAAYVEMVGARYHSGRDIANGIRCLGPQSPTAAQGAIGRPGTIERMVTDAMDTARLEAIEECAKHLESCGFRYSQGFDLPASLRRLKDSPSVPSAQSGGEAK